ncbi:hypothetical protein D3C80_1271020 [compost metagenome]
MAITSLCALSWRISCRVCAETPAKSLMMHTSASCPARAMQWRSALSSCSAFSLSGPVADSAWLLATTAAHSASTRARLRSGRICRTWRSSNTSPPTRSPAPSAIQADTAASSAATTDLKLRCEPKNMFMRWSTSSQVGRSRSSVKVRTKGLPKRSEARQSRWRKSSPGW